MPYTLGLDLGTTSSAAAVNEAGKIQMLTVDHAAVVIPSVVHLDSLGTWLVGTAAVRKAISDPAGVAREFKRRLGDPQPLLLSGTPVAANDLMLKVAEELVAIASRQHGGPPESLVVCHPANWGSYKVGLLADTLANSSLPRHTFVTEPEAAAIHYASLRRVEPNTTIGVYDLGGGTFDVAFLKKVGRPDGPGWEVIGEPRGIERLGGIDFDTAVLHHTISSLGVDLAQFDADDDGNLTAMLRLREECQDAKHALSADVAASIPVLLPGLSETIRITRREFEALIDPALARTLETVDVALTTTGLGFADVDRFLLVGGSTMVPLVSERLAAHTGRPIVTDAHPKHAMALGAAVVSGQTESGELPAVQTVVPVPPAKPPEPPPEVKPPGAKPPEPPPEVKPPAHATPPLPPSGAAPTPSELYQLPHIDDAPLPEFMHSRKPPKPPARQAQARPPAAPARPAPAKGKEPPATKLIPSEVIAPKSASLPVPARVGPVMPYKKKEGSGKSRGVFVFLASFVVVGVGLAALLIWQSRGGNDDAAPPSTTAAPTSTTAAGTQTTITPAPATTPTTLGGTCSNVDVPNPDLTYRVTLIPDTFTEKTLNGRNVPSTRTVNGVASNPVTTFFELSELDLTYQDCAVAENGRVWWGVNFEGQVVWASTRFIEQVPG